METSNIIVQYNFSFVQQKLISIYYSQLLCQESVIIKMTENLASCSLMVIFKATQTKQLHFNGCITKPHMFLRLAQSLIFQVFQTNTYLCYLSHSNYLTPKIKEAIMLSFVIIKNLNVITKLAKIPGDQVSLLCSSQFQSLWRQGGFKCFKKITSSCIYLLGNCLINV